MNRVGKRALFYIRRGYSLASLPFVFLGYASSIYYLAIENIPFLHRIFPSFSSFLILAGVTLPILCGLIGYTYMKRSWLFRVASEIQIESNPYTTEKIAPVSLPIYKLFKKIALKEGHFEIANQIDQIINKSEKFKKYVKNERI